jgi:hypothetical protein
MILWLLWGCTEEKNLCSSEEKEGPNKAFVEETATWGLDQIQAIGTRVSAVDYDGDGWTDLFIRKDTTADNFATGVRSSWLLRNDEGKGFVDVTESSGIRTARIESTGRPGQVVAFGDVDNDGDMDVFTGYNVDGSSSETSELMLNNGDGTFSLGAESNEFRESAAAKPAGAAFVDYNLDGSLDLWLGQANATQDRLFWGYGDGTFVDVTGGVNLQTSGWSGNSLDKINNGEGHTVSWSAAACDLNNDGWPDLLSASYGRAPNHLWKGNSEGLFENRSVVSGYAFDENQDWSDNESARCWCTLHPDATGCTDVPEPEKIQCTEDDDAFRWSHSADREPYRLGGNSGATICADINNDGWNDLLTTEIVHWDVGGSSDPSAVLLNNQDSEISFTRPDLNEIGLARTHDIVDWNDGDITGTVFDFDNDGLKDLYIGSTDYPGTRGMLYQQQADGTFVEVAQEQGLLHNRSHGVAVADFDRDGDLDMVIGHSSGRCDDDCPESFHARIYENQWEGVRNFIQVSLIGGAQSNKSAIGARVEVSHDGVTQMQEVGGGYGHYGAQNDLVLHFGLDVSCDVEVQITWPDASRSTDSYTLTAGSRYMIHQEDGVME